MMLWLWVWIELARNGARLVSKCGRCKASIRTWRYLWVGYCKTCQWMMEHV